MHVYFLSFKSDEWTSAEEILLSYTSPERYIRVLRYVHTADRKLSLYADLLTRMAITIHTPLTLDALHILYKENHKPFLFTDLPVDFNFSHTRNAILCCISLDSTVGADIEVSVKAPFQIMDMIFHPNELKYISAANEIEKQRRFFKIWTQKEAYTKRNGTGIICNLPDINTLEPSIASTLFSWISHDYFCSVCGNLTNPPIFHQVSTKDIFDFFTSS